VPVDVATFLLNEKRADIFRIESRLKVGITLIPNPHLETPNYSINRLRQDDMTSDVLQASYKLVEKPVEEKPLTAVQEQQKATRAQAVVQGVTPAQPAPMKAETAPPSMFGKIVSWFKSLSEEEQPKAKPPASRPRNAPRPERGERGERPEGGGKRRDRGGRGEKGERSEGGGNRDRNEPRGGQKPAQAEGKPQEPRQPRPPRPPRVAEEKPVLESQVATSAVEQAEAGSPPKEGARRRGRRGGRRERENRENAAQNAVASEAVIVQQSFEQMDNAPVKVGPTEYIAYPDGFVKPSEYIAMPTIYTPSLPAVVMPSQPAIVAPSLPAVVTPAPVAKMSGNGHGLVQIETDPVKLSSVAQITVPTSERHAPRRRERQREVYVENEPLVQIETQHPQG
jgi:ribonuclease E